MQRKWLLIILCLGIATLAVWKGTHQKPRSNEGSGAQRSISEGKSGENALHPLSIAAQRKKDYPGSPITIERTLEPGSNYQKYIASYRSDGLKIDALLTVPNGN